jgi:predicted dienelactone hydrolase
MGSAVSRAVIAACVVAVAVGLARAAPPAPDRFKVGAATRQFMPAGPYDWRGTQLHALVTTIWYPAAADAEEETQWGGPPGTPLFDVGKAAPGATLAAAPAKFPLILLSHGTGGTAQSLGWLAVSLAARGDIVAGVEHPGNNAIGGYTVQGFALWWERAADLSRVLDAMLADPVFGPRIDRQRIGGAGFSLGGYTMIEIAGGITSLAHFRQFCAAAKADASCAAPPEFADLRAKAEALRRADPAFAAALAGAGRSYRDPRLQAVFAMAPALGPAFLPSSLAKIDIPVAIVAGAADRIVPVGSSAEYFAATIPRAELTLFPGKIGHYVFTAECTAAGHARYPSLCDDAPGVDREAVHARTASIAAEFFARNLWQ